MTKPTAAIAALLLALSVAGCDEFTPGRTEVSPLVGSLALEIRDTADIEIAPEADGLSSTVTLSLSQGFGVAPADSALSGSGRIEAIAEAGATLYTARLSAPAQPAGPCGTDPVSLALSLHRQGANATVHGGLTAYCGAERWHGVPPRVLRLAGELPLH